MNKTVAIIVTYKNRFDLLEQVVARLKQIGVLRIVIVDNNSHPDSKMKINAILSDSIELISLEKNYGSAHAFSVGIQHVRDSFKDVYIWLLDDDNVPEIGALSCLLEDKSILDKGGCLLSLRPARPEYVKVSEGHPVEYVFPKKNSFLGFTISKFFHRNSNKLNTNTNLIKVPYAPYGGMLFSSSYDGELPNSNFFVYSDDHDFSYNFNESYGVYLKPKSIVKDIEDSWYVNTNRRGIHNYLKGPRFRVYYSVRNRAYLEYHKLVTNRFLYFVNVFTYLTVCFLFNLFGKTNFSLIMTAVKDGVSGNLGEKIIN